jgi:predicted phage terminase large subunit-like protein
MSTRAEKESELTRLEAEAGRRKLSRFVRMAWRLVEPSVDLVWNWHLETICDVLEDVTDGTIPKVIFNIPPGCAKSLIVSVFWPSWEWARDPSLRYFCASYGSHLSVRDNLRVRNIVKSAWYHKAYGVEFVGDQNAKERFDTTAGGWRIATSVGGAGTGEHPDRKIIDDPLTAEQARSEADRRTCRDWYDGTVATRGVSRGARTVVVMQRLHEEDLTGHLLGKGDFVHVRFPMRYEAARAPRQGEKVAYVPDPLDERTKDGELLWPALFDEGRVRALEISLGDKAAGQLQQRPAPEGGRLFKREWFKIVDAFPPGGSSVRGWDVAATQDGGDATAGVKIRGPVDGVYCVEDVAGGHLGSSAVDKLLKSTAIRDGVGTRVREEQEPGSSGKSVITARKRALVGFDYSGVTVTGDKIVRAGPFRAQAEGGNVVLLRGAWNAEYLDELCLFPVGAHDDQVDGTSCAFNDLVSGPQPMTSASVGAG